jgi:hypothetical protein
MELRRHKSVSSDLPLNSRRYCSRWRRDLGRPILFFSTAGQKLTVTLAARLNAPSPFLLKRHRLERCNGSETLETDIVERTKNLT